MIWALALFIVSLGFLIKSSDWFIDAAEKIGLALGVSPFIIGVTLVGFGTSLPELASSIASVFANESEVVVGNVIGSNVTNILLVLGLTSFFQPFIRMEYNLMDLDMPLLVISAFLMWFVLSDGTFDMYDSLLFIGGLVIFLINSLTTQTFTPKEQRPSLELTTILWFIVAGVIIFFSAEYTIKALVQMAIKMNASPDIIALTMVALGTSLPEVAVSITAARRGNPGLAVGNVLGSNIFNTYAVMAIPSFFGTLIIPDHIPDFSMSFMLGATVLFAVISLSNRISRWEGMMLIIFYLFFIGQLIRAH